MDVIYKRSLIKFEFLLNIRKEFLPNFPLFNDFNKKSPINS